MESRQILSKNLKAYRTLKKRTQLEFAQEIGISKSTLQDIEHGKSPTLDTVQCIAQHLGIPLSILLSDAIPPTQLEIIVQLIQGFDWFAQCSQEAQEELLNSILNVSHSLSVIKEERDDL